MWGIPREWNLSIFVTYEGDYVQGKVKWFDDSKGYGFIARSDGPDVFVYYRAILGKGYRTLTEGDSVEFEIVQGPKGPQAANVMKIPVHPKDRQAATEDHGPHRR